MLKLKVGRPSNATSPQAASGEGSEAAKSGIKLGSGLQKIMLKRKSTQAQPKTLKSKTPKLKTLNVKRPPPPRLPGHGYDSEDSDAEDDPAIQQAFVLRMQPGEDCDYLHHAISSGKLGLPQHEGPAEVSMRFLDKDFRRAIVTIRKRMYAAALVDLPCIVETMKSWDKKGWWKVADLCQMLLVLGRCNSEEEAQNFGLPREVDKQTMQYAHGLTPPMHWVRKRRFRKRLNHKTIANVEEEVERLLEEDEAAEAVGGESKMVFLDRADLGRSNDPEQAANDEDAQSEAMDTVEDEVAQEYFDGLEDDEGDPDLEGDLQAMFDAAASNFPPVNDPSSNTAAPSAQKNFTLGANTDLDEAQLSTPMQESEGEAASDLFEDSPPQSPSPSSSDEDDDEPESPEVLDEDAAARLAERNQQMEEIADLEKEVQNQKMKADSQKNQLLKEKALSQLRQLENDLRVKRGALGLDEDGEPE